jgi:hypothetical protein
METPEFFTMPGRWRAEGSIELPLGLEQLDFHAIWEGNGHIWLQQVFLKGVADPVINAYKCVEGDLPYVLLESPHLGSLHAELTVDKDRLGWEIRSENLSGYEWFQRQPDGSYQHRAEFTGEHGLRTVINSTLRWDGPRAEPPNVCDPSTELPQ